MLSTIPKFFTRYWRSRMLSPSNNLISTLEMCSNKQSQASYPNIKSNDTEKRIRTLKDMLSLNEVEAPSRTENKVTIVGAGQVGMATAFTLLTQNVTSNVTLIDSEAKRVSGEVLDLDRGSVFFSSGVEIHGSTHYEDSQDSDVCVLAAAASLPSEEETPQDTIQKNAEIFKAVVPRILKFSPDCILIIVSHAVDVMTYVAWRVSRLPANRVIGLGTTLDSAQFRTLIARELGFSPSSVDGWIIGEQGERSIPVWSGVNAAGVKIHDLIPNVDYQNKWNELHWKTIKNGEEVIKLKGYSSWALGLSVSALVQAVLGSTKAVYPVSTLVQGHYGVENEVFLSLPCVLYKKGIRNIVNQELTEKEKEMFHKSSQLVYSMQQSLHM